MTGLICWGNSHLPAAMCLLKTGMPRAQCGQHCGDSAGKSKKDSKEKTTSTGSHTSDLVCPRSDFVPHLGRPWNPAGGHIQSRPLSRRRIHQIITSTIYMCSCTHTHTHNANELVYRGENVVQEPGSPYHELKGIFFSCRHIT